MWVVGSWEASNSGKKWEVGTIFFIFSGFSLVLEFRFSSSQQHPAREIVPAVRRAPAARRGSWVVGRGSSKKPFSVVACARVPPPLAASVVTFLQLIPRVPPVPASTVWYTYPIKSRIVSCGYAIRCSFWRRWSCPHHRRIQVGATRSMVCQHALQASVSAR